MAKDDLTIKQRKWLDRYLQHGNATQAAREAGYAGSSETLASVGYENLRKLQVPMADLLDQQGLTDAALGRKLIEGLEAEVVKTASLLGKISDEKTYVDYPTRYKYLELILKVKGHLDKQPEKGAGAGEDDDEEADKGPISVTITAATAA